MIRAGFGIRARLLVLVLVATLPLLAVTAYSAWVLRSVQEEEMRADLLHLARSASDQIRSAAESGEQLLKALSRVPGVARGDAAECQRIFADILGRSKRYTAFFVMDATGQVLYHSAGLAEPLNLADRAYFQRVRATKRFSVGDIVVSRVTRKPVMTLAYPLLDAAGELGGVLVGGLDLQWFGERFDRARPDLNLIFAIWDQDATILYRYPDNEKWAGQRVAETGIGQAVLSRQTDSLLVETTGVTGIPTLYAVKGSEAWSDARFNINVGVAKAELHPAADRVLSYSVTAFGVVFVITLVAALRLAEVSIRRRVTALSTAAMRLTAGERGARTGLPAKADELGQLAAAFDGMADSLQAEHERVLQSSASLARVNRALRVLSECNSALVRAQDEDTLLQGMCRIVVNSGGYRMAWVGYAEHDEAKRIRSVAQAGYEEGHVEALNLTWADSERGRGPMGTAIRTGKVLVSRNIPTDPDSVAFREAALHRGYASSIGLPLTIDGRVLGALSICAAEPEAFDDREVELLVQLANDLAYGIQAARNRAELERHRNRLEEILRERNEGYGTVLRTAMDGFWIVDTRGRFLEVNGSYCQLIGYSRDELLAMSISDVEAVESSEETAARIETIMRDGSDRFETRHRRKDGAILDVEVSVNYLSQGDGKFFVFVRDVTERKRMEQALKDSKHWVEVELAKRSIELDESEKRFQLVATAIGQAPVSVLITDPDGRIVYVNPAFARISGYAPEEALGRNPRLLKSGRQSPEKYRELWATALAGKQWRGEFVNRRKDGSLYTQDLTVAPVRDGDGKVLHFIGVAVDVTERRQAEQALRKLAQQLRQFSRRLVEAEESARRKLARELHDHVGHSVTALSLNLHALRGELPEDRQARLKLRLDDCDTLLSNTAQMVRDVMSDLRPPGIDELGLVAALSEHARQVSSRAGLPLAVRGAEARPRLAPTSEIALFRIAQEALVNVIKHAAATRGTIDFEVGPDRVVLTIADDGRGFDPVAGGKDGLHLGLVSMRERAEAIDGVLRVESVPGQGTRVIIAAPRAAAASPP